jgi:CHAD domain-containing protein
MAEGKWISNLTASTPLEDAARHVLTVRLEVVRDYLPRALREYDKDSEHVHQLRVSTRRARAALDIFASCLPSRVHKACRKHLRRIRRAAGEARDWDVFMAGLSEWQRRRKTFGQAGLDILLGYVLAHREVAQTHLEEASQDYPFAFDRLLAETVAAVHKSSTSWHALVDLARPTLSGLLEELNQATAADLQDYVHLHRVRIIGKRLRYAMEVFVDCFDPSFRDQLYPAIEEMQEILGQANDSHVASERLTTLRQSLRRQQPSAWKRCRPDLDGLLRYHRHRLPRRRKRFQQWWQQWQTSGNATAFAALLQTS